MAINRVLYATQTVTVKTAALSWVGPMQTASADETIPQDDVLVLGKLGGAARLQKDVASCKASVKAYVADYFTVKDAGNCETQSTAGEAYIRAGNLGGANATTGFLNILESEAASGTAQTIWCDSTGISGSNSNDGFKLIGICSSMSIDASKGAFPMLDLSFEGVGRLETLNMGTGGTLSNNDGGLCSVDSVVPLTSKDVSLGTVIGGASGDTVASVKWSYDLPTETLSRLGGVIIGNHTQVKDDNKVFSKPPFKATMTADGQSLTKTPAEWINAGADAAKGAFMILDKAATSNGGVKVKLQDAGTNVSTRSFSQNVGDVGATFSVTAEGTQTEFTLT